ncbi:MAG TPA: MBL fold metallo-hydrolase [Minicystis sp.]|nr:MBL fold metallo-hydrolase [Minicystis sp.]
MRVYVLASGSDGNAAVVESACGARVLVDAGIGVQSLVQKLVDLGAGGMPDAIVVTHAHKDHVGQAARISKRLRIPVYALEATAAAARLGDRVRLFGPREPFAVGGLLVEPVPVPHDAEEVALRLSDARRSVAIATDVGEVTQPLVDHVARCDVVMVESNHDLDMLRWGPYPPFLKRRVESARGHLSNEQTHALLRRLSLSVRAVVLTHLSRTNNRPDIALEVARDALAGRRVHLAAAAPRAPFVVDADAPPPESPLPARPGRRPVRVASEQLSLFG